MNSNKQVLDCRKPLLMSFESKKEQETIKSTWVFETMYANTIS